MTWVPSLARVCVRRKNQTVRQLAILAMEDARGISHAYSLFRREKKPHGTTGTLRILAQS
jgi:hypothetical protein